MEISVQSLDFDRTIDRNGKFMCGVTLERGDGNIYCCLACGKFFKGRSQSTPAHDHFISTEHAVFINMTSLQIYDLSSSQDSVTRDLPEAISVIRENIRPSKYSSEVAPMIDAQGRSYMRGFVGLTGSSSLIHACVQLACHLEPVKDQLLAQNSHDSLHRVAKKMWLQAPLLNGLLHVHELKHNANAKDTFLELIAQLDTAFLRGTVVVSKKAKQDIKMRQLPPQHFTCLSLELPPVPLFPDAISGKLSVPQCNLADLIIHKFNSGNVFFDAHENGTAYDLQQLPHYLVLFFVGRPQNNTALLFDGNRLGVLKSTFRLFGQIVYDAIPGKYACIVRQGDDPFRLEDQSVSRLPPSDDALLVGGDIHLQVWQKIKK